MSAPHPFLHSSALEKLGVEHGFGMRGSAEAALSDLQVARQVHGATLVEAPFAQPCEADALFTRRLGLAVAVYTADCVPVLLADRGARIVASVHAGWRGTAAGIVGRAVRALAEQLGCAPTEFVAAIGPHIGPCCYEVDRPVIDRVTEPAVLGPGRPGHAQLDLGLWNELQLRQAGLEAGAISRVGECTACMPERYLSYRRDGGGGRMLHYIRK